MNLLPAQVSGKCHHDGLGHDEPPCRLQVVEHGALVHLEADEGEGRLVEGAEGGDEGRRDGGPLEVLGARRLPGPAGFWTGRA